MLKLLLPFRDSSEYILDYLKTDCDHISLQPFMFIILIRLPFYTILSM